MPSLRTTPREVLPPEIEYQVHDRLIGNEQVVWWGQPLAEEVGRRFGPASLIGLGIIGIAIYWTSSQIREALRQAEPSWAMAWLGLPMFLVGLGVLCVPLLATVVAEKTWYVLTNGRAMVFHGMPLGLRSISDYYPAQLRDMVCAENEGGIGDLVFERVESADADGIPQTKEYGFLGIENVRDVENLIHELFPPPGVPAPVVEAEPLDTPTAEMPGLHDDELSGESVEHEESPYPEPEPQMQGQEQ